MTPLSEARNHLAKAGRYLAAAEQLLESDLYDPAILSAIACGTHSKDAVCLKVFAKQ